MVANGDSRGAAASAAADSAELQDKAFFSFPYDPYEIQLQLMQQLYKTIDSSHIGIFESPTGTGKSISLICGTLAWLTKNTDEYGLLRQAPNATDEGGDKEEEKPMASEPSWLASFDRTNSEREERAKQVIAKKALEKIEELRQDPAAHTKKRKMGYAYNFHERKQRKLAPDAAGSRLKQPKNDQDGDDDKHLVDAYESDRAAHAADSSGSDSESEQQRRGGFPFRPEERPRFGIVKIIYCSRTHSQISQFIREIRNTMYGEHIRVVALGSRKNLCSNPVVSSLRSDLRMTDACLDMLQGAKKEDKKTKKPGKCPFYEKKLLGHYRDHALTQVHDIEDLHLLGQEMSICSYYGARESIPLAQIVAMPYSMLLSKDTRESMGIDLEGNIVIFDEAHNIVEAMNSTYKVEVTSKQFVVARRCVWAYFKKYEKRFKGKNSFYIKQLLSILECLTKFLRQLGKGKSSVSNQDAGGEEAADGSKMMTINDFLFSVRIDHFNMFKLLQYLSQSGLPKKILGFMDAETNAFPGTSASAALPADVGGDDDDEEKTSHHISPLRSIEALLKALTTATGDGRILAQPQNAASGTEAGIKFILLNPATHFEEIAQKARSVILAGGTMQPVAQVIDQLFSFVSPERIDLFSCGHVIPPENLVGFSLSSGPSQRHLEFTFARRQDTEALDELGRILLNLSRVVPGGVVVFFPSYRFEELVVNRWRETKQFDEISARKPVFREPKQSDELALVLTQYAAACAPSSTGEAGNAMLLSVVGGKMSEGINFSDDLARCVVMVGLPYPNARDPELLEKMSYLDKRQPGSGRLLYESLCMKAVNQSIGRAIRHQNDYASIVLVDHRYANPSIRKKLPEWIQKRVQPPMPFGQMYSQLVPFYRSKEKAS